MADEMKCTGCGDDVHARMCTGCATPMLAKALFRTDARAVVFVDGVADCGNYAGEYEDWDYSDERLERAWAVAWERNEGGWRTEAETRAREVIWNLQRATLPNGPDQKEGG